MAKPTPPSDFHYRHKGDFTEGFLASRLWPGHYVAWEMVKSAIIMLNTPLSPEALGTFLSFFGKQANDPPYFAQIKTRFIELEKNLFEEYWYIFKAGGPSKLWANTDRDGQHDITLRISNLQKYTIAGMAGLILHENVHRLGLFDLQTMDNTISKCHFGIFRDVDGTGECIIDIRGNGVGMAETPTEKLLVNCDSYACVSAWAHTKGYLYK